MLEQQVEVCVFFVFNVDVAVIEFPFQRVMELGSTVFLCHSVEYDPSSVEVTCIYPYCVPLTSQ